MKKLEIVSSLGFGICALTGLSTSGLAEYGDFGPPSAIAPSERMTTEGPASKTLCRVKAWQNPTGGYEAGRYDPNTDRPRSPLGACHYGWGNEDAWAGGPTMQFLRAVDYVRWRPWEGDKPSFAAVGTQEGNAFCEALLAAPELAWWPGKIIFGTGNNRWECDIPVGGRVIIVWPNIELGLVSPGGRPVEVRYLQEEAILAKPP